MQEASHKARLLYPPPRHPPEINLPSREEAEVLLQSDDEDDDEVNEAEGAPPHPLPAAPAAEWDREGSEQDEGYDPEVNRHDEVGEQETAIGVTREPTQVSAPLSMQR